MWNAVKHYNTHELQWLLLWRHLHQCCDITVTSRCFLKVKLQLHSNRVCSSLVGCFLQQCFLGFVVESGSCSPVRCPGCIAVMSPTPFHAPVLHTEHLRALRGIGYLVGDLSQSQSWTQRMRCFVAMGNPLTYIPRRLGLLPGSEIGYLQPL